MIEAKGGSSITLDATDGSITISAKGSLTISAKKEITLSAMNGNRSIKLTANDIESDYRALQDDGSEGAIVAVWKRDGDKVRLFWAAEGGPETADPVDPHLAPDPTPLWNILDMTPDGRAANWYPKTRV